MIHFVVHDENDSVGVVVVEGIKAGQKLEARLAIILKFREGLIVAQRTYTS